MKRFNVALVVTDGQVGIALTGQFDGAVSEAVTSLAMSRLAEADVDRVLIDLAAVTFIDSSGIGALLAIQKVAVEVGKSFALRRPGELVLRVFVLAGLEGSITVIP